MALEGPVARGLRELADRYGLSSQALERLEVLLGALTGDQRAPTTVRDQRGALHAHIADSLVALELAEVRAPGRVADIGAGAGLPGLALASALEESSFWLVDSQASKCSFMAAVGGRAGIGNARVVCARIEEWNDGAELQDLVVCRALAPQPVVMEYASPLLKAGGHLVSWRGARSDSEERVAAAAAEMLSLSPVAVHHVQPFAEARDRHLHVFKKTGPTPSGFPRRTGLARKRPLGG